MSNIGFLAAFLNSSLFKFCFRDNFPELFGNTRELSKIFFDKIPVVEVDDSINSEFTILIKEIQQLQANNVNSKHIEIQIDKMINKLYDLTEEESQTIGFIEIQ